MAKCVLAFSGGLEQLAAIRWLKEEHDATVIALVQNLGQVEDHEELGEQALVAGASSARIDDLREEFVRSYVCPALFALAHYEQRYLLGSALSRPLTAQQLVRTAKEENATAIAHAFPPEGNDQLRLESALAVLTTNISVWAPQREWPFQSREEMADYITSRGVRLRSRQSVKWRRHCNLWGQSIQSEHFDPTVPPPEEVFTLTKPAEGSPDTPKDLEIGFKSGKPISLDGSKMPAVALIDELGKIAGEYGIGRSEIVEDRLVGFKSLEVYEAPAAEALYTAKRSLERLVLDRGSIIVRENLAESYGRCIYDGHWHGQLRQALDEFFKSLNEVVTGTVKLRLYKGVARVLSVDSPFSLVPQDDQEKKLTTFGSADAEGFIKIRKMSSTAEAQRRQRTG